MPYRASKIQATVREMPSMPTKNGHRMDGLGGRCRSNGRVFKVDSARVRSGSVACCVLNAAIEHGIPNGCCDLMQPIPRSLVALPPATMSVHEADGSKKGVQVT